jgi:S-DNA-T family DNA segregation ATPase FtsK/SpoIIIE
MVTISRLELDSEQLDILGLGLVAIGVFLAGVAYLGWSGGVLGRDAMRATRFTLGVIGYAVPGALAAGGALVLIRDSIPTGRPSRPGIVCLAASVTLGIAAGTLAIGPGVAPAHSYWRATTFEPRAGVLGQAELWVATGLFSQLGADILALFLLMAAVVLISRVTVAELVRATLTGGLRAARSLSLPRRARWLTVAPCPARDRETAIETGDMTVLVDDGPPNRRGDAAQVIVPTQPGSTRAADTPVGSIPDEERGDLDAQRSEADWPIDVSRYEPGDHDEPDTWRCVERAVADAGAFEWNAPSSRLLTRSTGAAARPDTAGQEEVARMLLETLGHFGIDAALIGRVTGPHITRYELRLAPGTKVGKVAQMGDDLAYALAATDIRILAPIPGKQAVGVEVPNVRRRIVHLGDVFQDPPTGWSPLTVWLGKDIAGRAIGADLTKMPHLLVAGTTGAGKSACLNTMLCSILLRATPDEARFVLVDPKQVELNHYELIPHLLTPVITSPRTAANALQNLIGEMERRYDTMSLARTRSLMELNRVRESRGESPLPYILCVIDEFADLMMVSPAEVEETIIRLAQKARAVGIHLLLATQSPRADVITGMIKANVPSRIAFAVSSQADSRVILDQNGAESLLGQGDMLFSPLGEKVQRLQGAYIDEREIAQLTDAWRRQGEPQLHDELLQDTEQTPDGESELAPVDADPLLEDAIELVAQMGTASTSMLQRRLRLGYTRAGRLIDMLERRGVISGYEGSKPRQVLIAEADVPRVVSELHQSGVRAER